MRARGRVSYEFSARVSAVQVVYGVTVERATLAAEGSPTIGLPRRESLFDCLETQFDSSIPSRSPFTGHARDAKRNIRDGRYQTVKQVYEYPYYSKYSIH